MKADKKYSHGFKVPSDYFDTLDEALELKMLEGELPQQHGFKISEAYFENFEDSLLGKLKAEDDPVKTKVIQLWPKRLGYVAAIAASLLLGWALLSPSDTISLEELPVAEVEQYIQNGHLNLEVYDIAQLLSESDIQEFNTSLQFEEAQLESYLMEHLDESTLLME